MAGQQGTPGHWDTGEEVARGGGPPEASVILLDRAYFKASPLVKYPRGKSGGPW